MGVSAMVLFDTNRLVKQLKVAGFRISTAVHLCNLIKEVVGPAVGCVSAQSVTRSVFEQASCNIENLPISNNFFVGPNQ